jgi:hypothetical protein
MSAHQPTTSPTTRAHNTADEVLMQLELTTPDGQPVTINSDWVGHYMPDGQGTIFELGHLWTSDPPEARTILVVQPYALVFATMLKHQAKPNAVVSLHQRQQQQRRRR